MIYRDHENAQNAEHDAEQQKQAQMAQIRVRLWEQATGKTLEYSLEHWLEKQTGKPTVTLDYVYTRTFRASDVIWNGGPHAEITGTLLTRAEANKNPELCFSWKTAMILDEDGSWYSDRTDFTEVPLTPDAMHWRIKTILPSKVFRDLGIQ